MWRPKTYFLTRETVYLPYSGQISKRSSQSSVYDFQNFPLTFRMMPLLTHLTFSPHCDFSRVSCQPLPYFSSNIKRAFWRGSSPLPWLRFTFVVKSEDLAATSPPPFPLENSSVSTRAFAPAFPVTEESWAVFPMAYDHTLRTVFEVCSLSSALYFTVTSGIRRRFLKKSLLLCLIFFFFFPYSKNGYH